MAVPGVCARILQSRYAAGRQVEVVCTGGPHGAGRTGRGGGRRDEGMHTGILSMVPRSRFSVSTERLIDGMGGWAGCGSWRKWCVCSCVMHVRVGVWVAGGQTWIGRAPGSAGQRRTGPHAGRRGLIVGQLSSPWCGKGIAVSLQNRQILDRKKRRRVGDVGRRPESLGWVCPELGKQCGAASRS